MAQKIRHQSQTLSGYPEPNFSAFSPSPILANRAPTTLDTGYPLGIEWLDRIGNDIYFLADVSAGSATWNLAASNTGPINTLTGNTGGAINPSAGNINILGAQTMSVSGSGSTLTINPSSQGYPITPYVVGPVGYAGYQTVQSAVTAAESAGGGIVYIQPGTYTENVTMGMNVHIFGIVGASGNTGLTIDGGEVPSVNIIGNFTLDVTAAPETATTVIKNIQFFCSTGNLFTYIGNIQLFESGYLTLYNCYLQTGTSAISTMYLNGYMNVNFISTVVNEETANSNTFLTFGAISFINMNFRDSLININSTNACIIPNSSYITFNLDNTYYSARIDTSGGSTSFYFVGTNLFINFNGSSPGDPLMNYGSNDGSVNIQNCIISQSSGSLANCTSLDSPSIFTYHSCVFNNPVILGSTARGDFSFCEIFGYTDPAVTMSSSQNVSFIGCILNSTNNPCITGSGMGTITLGDITFTNNSIVGNSLNVAWFSTKMGPATVTGNLTLASSGNKLNVTTGTNASAGTSSAMSAGAVTVNTSSVTASSLIFLTANSLGTVLVPSAYYVSAITPSTSFTITSSQPTDTSTINWWIIN